MSHLPAFAPKDEAVLEFQASKIMDEYLADNPALQATQLAEYAAWGVDHDEWLDDEIHWVWELALAKSTPE